MPLVFDCPAIVIVHHPDKKCFELFGSDDGVMMSLEEMRDLGKAMVQYLTNGQNHDVLSN